MTVECPACKTIFPVDPSKVPTAGVHARCSVCGQVFFVAAPPARVFPEAPEPVPPTEGEAGLQGVAVTAPGSGDDLGEQDSTWAERETEKPEAPRGEPEPEFGYPEPIFTMDSKSLGAPVGADAIVEENATPPGSVDPAVAPSSGPLFGRRDPMEKAHRLARVLVSDIILYNPDRHRTALEGGRVREEFAEEILKSWTEYVEQVGEEIADGTPFFAEALDEILAEGNQSS